MPRSRSTQSSSGSPESLRSRLLALLGRPRYQPLDTVGLSRELGVSSDDRSELRRELKKMESEGLVALIRKNRYVLPESADLLSGVIQFHQGGDAHVVSGQRGRPDLYIAGENTWTAMNGDTVLARLMHEGVADRRGRPQGRVIRILKRANPTIVGTLQQSRKFYFVIPDDPKIQQDIYVHPGEVALEEPPKVGDKVVVKLDPWESRHVNPEGEIIEVLGDASKPGVELLSIVRKYRLPDVFPEAVLREADRIAERVTDEELDRREDLRERMIVTIDPDDAKDFDDAIEVEKRDDGWRLGVHIADVSHYVRPGSALDREAFVRGNSVYLVDRVIPMLPEALSNGICSLKPEAERLTFSAFMDFTPGGRMRSARFARTVIRSARRLTYKEAFTLLQSSPGDEMSKRLRVAWELASLLRKKRFEHGSLDLDFPEIKVWLDEEKRPVRLERIENDISHQLIEEFMLAANEAVAAETKRRVVPSIYRVHDQPDPDKLGEYRELIRSYGIKAGDLTQRSELIRVMKLIEGRPDEYALKTALLRSLKRAEYDPNPLGHYGLAKVNYTHFTSPIRRYADLVVHRVLEGLPGGRSGKRVASTDLPAVTEHISATERVAADAERESVKLKKLEYFQAQLDSRRPEAFEAVVVDVRSYGLLVELPQFLLTGLIHVSALGGDFFEFDSTRLRFVGRRTRAVFGIGDRLEVGVAKVDLYKQQVDFFVFEQKAPKSSGRRMSNRGVR